MDIATLLGLILAFLLMFMGMTFDINTFSFHFNNVPYFIDPPSIMIVFGGTFASVLASFSDASPEEQPQMLSDAPSK